MKTATCIFALAFLPLLAMAQRAPWTETQLETMVQRVLKEFEVPGLSLAVVKDGRVLVTRGFGVKTLGESGRVDERTLFGIASNTKAFTATALALLVEEGKIQWDGRVIDDLPWFQMADPYVTREMTVRDLLVHRSGLGLGAGDLLWWPASTYDRKEIARRLRYVPLETSFRSAYAYDNVLYTIAGELIEEVSGKTWEEFIQTRILDPVGMTTSTVSYGLAAKTGLSATTHAKVEGVLRIVFPDTSNNTNPAGGINSNASDMAKWMIVQLDSGRIGQNRRLFEPGTARELWSVVTPIGVGTVPPELKPLQSNFSGYGLGFGLKDFRGYKVVTHTGGLPGYVSRLTMIPELKIGVCVLTNQESGAAFDAVTYWVLDRFLKAPEHDWIAAYKAVTARYASMTDRADETTAAARNKNTRPSLALDQYAGMYRDAWYGDIEITRVNDKLRIRFTRTPDLIGDLEHWHYDTFVARWHNREMRADAFVTFTLTPEGSVEEARMKAFSPSTDFSFDFHHLLLRPVKQGE